MLCRVMFGRIICQIVLCTFPVDVELLLALSIPNPIKTHVHCFGSALNDSVSKYSYGAFVVELERSGALRVAHFGECCAHRDGVFSVDEAGAGFGLLDGRHDSIDYFAVDEDRCVEWRRWIIRLDWDFWFSQQVEVASIAGSCFAFVEIGSIGVEPKVHFGGFVLDSGVGMSGGVVEELIYTESNVVQELVEMKEVMELTAVCMVLSMARA